MAPNTEKIIKKPAMKIVASIVTLPKKSKWRPIMNSTIPIRIQLSSNTLHILEIEKTGQPYLVSPDNSIISYDTSTLDSLIYLY